MAERRKAARWHIRLGEELFIRFMQLAFVLLGSTWRVRLYGRRNLQAAEALGGPILFAGWHGRMTPMIPAISRPPFTPLCVLISSSRDGYRVGRVMEGFGAAVVNGSTGRDGARGLRAVLRYMRDHPGHRIGMLVDGGRGPRGFCKAGIVHMARAGGGVIVPLLTATDRVWQNHRTWDRARLPRPFARVSFAFLPPVTVPRRADEHSIEAIRSGIERAMVRGTEVFDRFCHGVDPHPIQKPGGDARDQR